MDDDHDHSDLGEQLDRIESQMRQAGHDHADLDERLDRIESQMRQVRVLLIVLLLAVAVGLPGALSTVLGASLVALLIGAAVVIAWALLYLFDVVLLRRLREKREKEMERDVLEAFHRARAAEEE